MIDKIFSSANQSAPIVIFVPFLDAFGGVERLVLSLSRFLHEQNRAHTVACFGHKIDLRSHASWPITVEMLGFTGSPWRDAKTLAKYLQRMKATGSPPALLFDLKSAFYMGLASRVSWTLHLTDPPSLLPSDTSKLAPSARAAFTPFARLKKPGMLQSVRPEIVHRINRRGARNATNVIVMTQHIKDELTALYAVTPQIVRPGIRPISETTVGDASSPHRKERKLRRLLSVSRLEANKRIDWIFKALACYETQTTAKSAWVLDVVGIGSQAKELESLARELGVSERVIFRGQVSDARLNEIYQDADVFLMPAVQGYGLPALESLSAGLPVILHRESGVAEILESTSWVEIIDSEIPSLTQAIDRMLQRLQGESFDRSELPKIPTDEEWAREICQACGW